MRVLILDFDFFSARGGGQTFYRRIVERHPDWEFHYPSRGRDMKEDVRSKLPPNATPFAVERSGLEALVGPLHVDPELNVMDPSFGLILSQVAVALQGQAFDLVEVPSFLPVAHLVRPIFASLGVVVGNISLGMLGWLSVGIRHAYNGEIESAHVIAVDELEARCVAGSDASYTISDLHAAENELIGRASATIDMHDALEEFDPPLPEPPGEGPPDLWYVGRLDRNKGPDIFIDIVSRVPKSLYNKVYLTGPDNVWASGLRWSEEVLGIAQQKGVEANYLGEIDDETLRRDVYRGRTVVVVPSRSDAFNYVALEALLNGCPLILSNKAGAADFLRLRHPDIAPPIIDPEDVPNAARALTEILEDFPASALKLRKRLLDVPWPKPTLGFMAPVVASAKAVGGQYSQSLLAAIQAQRPLETPFIKGWRRAWSPPVDEEVCVVVTVDGNMEGLELTLLSLCAWADYLPSIVVIDNGSPDALAVRRVVASFAPRATLIRHGARGSGAALMSGFKATSATFVSFVEAGDGVDPLRLRDLARLLADDPSKVGACGAWAELDAGGRPTRLHAPRPFDARQAALKPRSAPLGAVMRRACIVEMGGVDASLDRFALIEIWNDLHGLGEVVRDQALTAWRWKGHRAEPSLMEHPQYTAYLRRVHAKALRGLASRSLASL